MTNTYNPPIDIDIIFTMKEIKTITKVFVPYPLTLNQQVQFNYSFDLLHKHFRSFTVLENQSNDHRGNEIKNKIVFSTSSTFT